MTVSCADYIAFLQNRIARWNIVELVIEDKRNKGIQFSRHAALFLSYRI